MIHTLHIPTSHSDLLPVTRTLEEADPYSSDGIIAYTDHCIVQNDLLAIQDRGTLDTEGIRRTDFLIVDMDADSSGF